jgi:hypothetical protein
MNWTAYLNRCAAFKPFRPHPPAAGPCDVGAARSGVAGVSIRPPSPDAALAEILGDDYLATVAHSIRQQRTDAALACRHELRERLQALEAWKIDAGLELPIIEDLIWHYRDALGISGKRESAIATPTGTLDPFDEAERRN